MEKVNYDSTVDTLLHIKRVSQLLTEGASELIRRANVHDDSKLKSPEKELFDKYTPLLKDCTYGSEQYREYLKGLKVALDHHYRNNSHHPEWTFTNEEWRTSHIFPDIIKVSNKGRVKHSEFTVEREYQGNFAKPEKILVSHVTPKGYLRLQLTYKKERKNVFVHTLVAVAFLGNPPTSLHQVNHKDGNKLNNSPNNLEWLKPTENLQHSYDIGLRDGSQRKYIVHCEELDITTMGATKMARKLKDRGYEKANGSSILACINGTSSQHLGLHFEAILLKDASESNSGVNGMDLFDILEMYMDWKAATERHADGNILKSIEINKERFNISEQICDIFRNTAKKLGHA